MERCERCDVETQPGNAPAAIKRVVAFGTDGRHHIYCQACWYGWNNAMPRQLRQVCAWCQREGRLTVLRDGAEPTSHGICPQHAAKWRAELARELAR